MWRRDFVKWLAAIPFLDVLVRCDGDPTGPEEPEEEVAQEHLCPTCQGRGHVCLTLENSSGVHYGYEGYLPEEAGPTYIEVPCPDCSGEITWYTTTPDPVDRALVNSLNRIARGSRQRRYYLTDNGPYVRSRRS